MKALALVLSVFFLTVCVWILYKYFFKPYFWPVKKKHITFERPKWDSPSKDFMRRWNLARDMGDAVGMNKLMYEYRAKCPQANSYCLTEVFCPECPYCALVVRAAVKDEQVE